MTFAVLRFKISKNKVGNLSFGQIFPYFIDFQTSIEY